MAGDSVLFLECDISGDYDGRHYRHASEKASESVERLLVENVLETGQSLVPAVDGLHDLLPGPQLAAALLHPLWKGGGSEMNG